MEKARGYEPRISEFESLQGGRRNEQSVLECKYKIKESENDMTRLNTQKHQAEQKQERSDKQRFILLPLWCACDRGL